MALVMFLKRIFVTKTFQLLCWALFGWILISSIIIIFMTTFQCIPLEYNWEGWTGEFGPATCLNVNALSYAAAISGIAQDVAILILPIPTILKLQLPLKKKILTTIMFSLGVFVTFTSSFRLRYLVEFAKSRNPTWDYTDAVIWTSAEVNVTVIVLCLPAIRQFLSVFIPGVFGTTAATHQDTPLARLSGQRSSKYAELTKTSDNSHGDSQIWKVRDADSSR